MVANSKGGGKGSSTGSNTGGGQSSIGRKGAVQKVKNAKSRKPSSVVWLSRHINDPYVQEAERRGYRSRAAFKIIQLQEKFNLMKPHDHVLDLGAAPGGWSQIAADIVGLDKGHGKVLAIDILEMETLAGVQCIQLDFTLENAPSKIFDALGGEKVAVVLSDMAAPTTGHRTTDHIRTTVLAEMALDFALQVLKPSGHFVTKVFQGGSEKAMLDILKKNFRSVHHFKPDASRAKSPELYVVGMEFTGGAKLEGE